MKYLRAQNVTRNVELGRKIRSASTLLERVTGLLTTKSLASDEGLWISPCASIHTFFMRYPIDVLFIDADGTVISQKTYDPWTMSAWHGKSRGALELATGTAQRTGTQVGDRIEMKDLN